MDPRCYFSTSWWRAGKQRLVDWLKQRARAHLLSRHGGRPLEEPAAILQGFRELIGALRRAGAQVAIVGLLPVDERTFPGSSAHFDALNSELRKLAAETGAQFVDWKEIGLPTADFEQHFYRDGFHPNKEGADRFGRLLADYVNSGAF